MRAKLLISICLIAGLILAVTVVFSAKKWAAKRQALELAKAQRAIELARQSTPQLAPVSTTTEIFVGPPLSEEVKPPDPAPISETPMRPPANKPQKDAKPKKAKTKPPLEDPDARDALRLVGTDPAAELYWYYAINDPT